MCDCVSTINKKLLDAGHNTRIKTPLTVNHDLSAGGIKLEIVTEKADPQKRKKAVPIFSTYCPFCGKSHKAA